MITMDRSTEEQYHDNLKILVDRYDMGLIPLEELEYCLHGLLEDIFDTVEDSENK